MEDLLQIQDSMFVRKALRFNDTNEIITLSHTCKYIHVNARWIQSVQMCKLLLVLGWTVVYEPFSCDVSIRRTLILNGHQLDYEKGLRRGFVEYRNSIVAFLGLKSKRKIFQDLDRFVIREIAFSVWASRYDSVECIENVFQSVCLYGLLLIALMSSELFAAIIFFIIRAYTNKKISVIGVLCMLFICFIYFSVSKSIGRAISAYIAIFNFIFVVGI